jgi:hypothetical protein
VNEAHDIARVIAELGGPPGDPVVDFLVDPGAACAALDARADHEGIVARVFPELRGAAGPTHGPVPRPPLWARVMRGAREIGLATSKGDGMVRRAEFVAIEERDDTCCDAPGCDKKRRHTAVWLALEPFPEEDAPNRLLVAEQHALPEGAPATALAVASRLASALGVPLRRGDEEIDAGKPSPPEPLGELVAASELARFSVRSEGDEVVLRDWESVGPRATAARNGWIGAALLAAAVVAWLELRRSLNEGSAGVAAAAGIVAALLTLAGYAFIGVARYSARYRAACAPLVAVGRDRIVVLPWVGRDGAVDVRPEGRLGAAIPLSEVRSARTRPHGRGVAVELDTDHGAIDAMVCPTSTSAELWCGVLDRIVDEARHPRAGASARQRARISAARGASASS